MTIFVVSRRIGVSEFRKVGPTFLDNKSVFENLSAHEDAFVFENYADAVKFVQTIGCAEPNSFGLIVVDFPIFQIESFEYAVRERELPAVRNHSLGTIYVSDNIPFQYLDRATTFKESKGFDRNKIKIDKIHSVRNVDYAIQYLNQLPFFRALNPFSEHSSVYAISKEGSYGAEIKDKSMCKSIVDAIHSDLDFISGLKETYNILTGVHYGMDAQGKGAKGLLDFLILPLLARKLFSDAFLPENANSSAFTLLAILIAAPIELLRAGTGLILTVVLSPMVAAVHLLKNICQCLIGEESNNEPLISMHY